MPVAEIVAQNGEIPALCLCARLVWLVRLHNTKSVSTGEEGEGFGWTFTDTEAEALKK